MLETFEWSEEKNRWLVEVRGIGFEAVVNAIKSGKLLAVQEHYNQDKYPGQKIYYVEIDSYVFVVPAVEDSGKIFLTKSAEFSTHNLIWVEMDSARD